MSLPKNQKNNPKKPYSKSEIQNMNYPSCKELLVQSLLMSALYYLFQKVVCSPMILDLCVLPVVSRTFVISMAKKESSFTEDIP